MIANIEAAARAAAHWWRERLGTPKDNGDRSRHGDVTNMLATLAQEIAPSSAADKFEESLRSRLVEKIGERRERVWLSLGVDYHPDAILGDALEASGMRADLTSALPWKTHMSIASDKEGRLYVSVSAGYAAPNVDIWKEEGAVTSNEIAAAREAKRQTGACICDLTPQWDKKIHYDWSCLVEGHGKCRCAEYGKRECSQHHHLEARS